MEIQNEKGNSEEMMAHQGQDNADFLLMSPQEIKMKSENSKRCLVINKIMMSIPYQIFITSITLYSLFSDDVRIIGFGINADSWFDVINFVIISIFSLQIIISWFVIEDYKLSFFFFLDVISTLSIVLDLGILTSLMSSSSQANISKISSRTKTTRAATRIVRLVKLFRIIRIMKLYKSAIKAQEIKEENSKRKQKTIVKIKPQIIQNLNPVALPLQQPIALCEMEFTNSAIFKKQNNQDPALQDPHVEGQKIAQEPEKQKGKKQSQISKVLSEMTIKKVIIAVLLLMFIIPLFDTENYIDNTDSWDYTTKHIIQALKNPNIAISDINDFITTQIAISSGWDNYIVKFNSSLKGLPTFEGDNYNNLRISDFSTSFVIFNFTQFKSIRPNLTLIDGEDQENCIILAVINSASFNSKDSIFGICKTFIVCLILIGLLHYFSADINELIVNPIEEIMQRVIKMAKNPEKISNQVLTNNQYETAMVHNAISKVGALLSLVFGNAGAEIIGSNIMNRGDMNPILGGKKKCAIFGFCDIRHFSEITEVLQEDIMVFVNTIAELVHSSVYRYGGNANKNIGEAFLLVWNIPGHCYQLNTVTNAIKWTNTRHLSILADFSVFSFIKTIIKINKDQQILAYRNDQRLTQKFNGEYKLDMGFGLHLGWAIEGAIGSQYKIDASYLSPNVNMASRLEAATKQFGVILLISEVLYKVLTPEMQSFCRNIDRVTVKGSNLPITLYTVDLNLDEITPSMNKQTKYKDISEMKDIETKKQENMKFFEQDKINEYNAIQFVKNKKQLRQVLINVHCQQFKKRFNEGFDNYIAGKWSDSRLHLSEALKIGNNDGPTKSLLKYMKRFDNVAPKTWKNYRELTEK